MLGFETLSFLIQTTITTFHVVFRTFLESACTGALCAGIIDVNVGFVKRCITK